MCLVAFVGIGLLLSVVSTHAEVTNVAFTAGFHADQTIGGGKIVAFKDVFTNLGNGYDSNTGVFTAPKRGLYVTSVNALTLVSKEFLIDLYRNNIYVISAFAQIPEDYAYGGNSVVLPLLKNDRVYVKTRRTAYFYGRQDEVYATFTGYLIGSTNASFRNVAFTAGFQEDKTIVDLKSVVYNKVFINSGRGYNNNTGVFTAAEAGVYGFQIRALAPSKKEFRLNLYKNDKYLISAFARHSAFGGNSIVLKLQKNDTVYLRGNIVSSLYGRSNDIYATFTGFLIGTFSCKNRNVAFTAGFNNAQTIEGKQTIAYKEVFTNVAGGYNNINGVFTAPKGGVYVFNIDALAAGTKEFFIDLYQNYQYLISAFALVKRESKITAGGNTIALQLKRGDTVHVQTRRTAYFYSEDKFVYATFSGYLINTSC